MKNTIPFITNKSMHLFVFSMMLAFFVFPAFSQKKEPQAGKFDEFTHLDDLRYAPYGDEERKEISRRAARYARQLRLERAQPYIIQYKPRVREPGDYSFTERWASNLPSSLSSVGFDYEKIKVVDGGLREQGSVELWVVPPGAKTPPLAPAFKPEAAVVCPKVYAYSSTRFHKPGKPIEFTASIYDDKSNLKPIFSWKVAGGTIIDGQGTPDLKVEPLPDEKTVRVKVSVEGFSPECPWRATTAAAIGELNSSHSKIDEFGRLSTGDMKARLDQLAIALQEDSSIQGYVVIYGGRSALDGAAAKRLGAFMKNYLFQMRGIDSARVTFIDDVHHEVTSTELWIAVKDAGAPPLTPTVDKKYITRRR